MNYPYVRRMIPEPGDPKREVPVPETFYEQTDDELTEAEIKQMEADDQAIQTILLGLPEDIYAAVDSCEMAKKLVTCSVMMKGSEGRFLDIGIQEKKAKLFNEWERFTSTDGESIESYYHRFSKLMNDFKRNKHFPEKIANADGWRKWGNQFRQYAGQNFENQVVQNAVQNQSVQNVRNQNGVIVVPGIANQNGNGNVVAARAEGNANGNNGQKRRDAAYLQTQLLIAQKEETGIQLQAEEFDLMVATTDLDKIKKGSAEKDSTISFGVSGVEQEGGTVEQHPVTVEETRAYFESLYNNLAIEVEKVNTVNRKLRETNADLTTELARYKNQEKCFEISQEKYDKLERCVSDTLEPFSQKLDNENVELEFQIRNYAKENAHLKTAYQNLFDPINDYPLKTSREGKSVPNKPINASVRTNSITVSQPHVITKKDAISDSNGVGLYTLVDSERFWELSGIPCVHVMAAYYHMNMEPELGENTRETKKQRIRHPTEDEHHVSGVGRVMHCHNCWEVGHNKKGCQNQQRPKPSGMGTSIKSQLVPNSYVDQSTPPAVKKETIRIGSPIKRGEENQVTEGDSMDDGNLTAEEAEQERIRQIWAENEANDLYWENIAKEFRDEELLRPEDSLDNAYSFDTISDFHDNELNVHQVSVDLPANEAPENYTTEESQAEDPDPKPIVPTQESQIQTRSKIRKQVAASTSMRIFVKNGGRSERIAMMKAKKFKFDANGTGSIADKAFNVFEDKE
ncbi:hypothetical protein Tco_0117624 [Tanacetum coccineum]